MDGVLWVSPESHCRGSTVCVTCMMCHMCDYREVRRDLKVSIVSSDVVTVSEMIGKKNFVRLVGTKPG